METSKLTKAENQLIAERILADVYSCLKVQYKMNIDSLDTNIMTKVLMNFDLSVFNIENVNFMQTVSSICYPIAHNPLNYFNFSYRKPHK
jgi:hypothetical protein